MLLDTLYNYHKFLPDDRLILSRFVLPALRGYWKTSLSISWSHMAPTPGMLLCVHSINGLFLSNMKYWLLAETFLHSFPIEYDLECASSADCRVIKL